MKLRAILLFWALLGLTTGVFAQNVSKANVEKMLKSMVEKGIIKQEQAAEAESKLNSMSSGDWDSLNEKANGMAAKYKGSNPDVGNSADSAAQNIDFDSDAFKDIQNQVKEVLGDQ